jgi:streptogramin lyase
VTRRVRPAFTGRVGLRPKSLARGRSSAVLITALLGAALAGVAGGQVITEFAIPAPATPWGITAGPDGNLWFTDTDLIGKIGRITPAGEITEFTLPANPFPAHPLYIAAGPDGNLWFTSSFETIGRITTSGIVTEFLLQTLVSPVGIAAGPDGNLWFTEFYGSRIGRITPAGKITEFPLPGPCPTHELRIVSCLPFGIAAGPDGNLWFTESAGGDPGQPVSKIGRITPAGKITEFPLRPYGPEGIAVGPDGNLWFTATGLIGRISTAGEITEFAVPSYLAPSEGIVAGPDGNLWFTTHTNGVIGQITPAGVVSGFRVSPDSSGVSGLAAGPDGNLWFTEDTLSGIGKIARITFPIEPYPRAPIQRVPSHRRPHVGISSRLPQGICRPSGLSPGMCREYTDRRGSRAPVC